VTGVEGTIFADNRGRFILSRGRGRLRLRLFRRDSRGHEAMLREFADAVESGRPPATDGQSGRRDLAVVLAAYRSVAERRPVDLAC
jgi:predicted dehydrogenase